MRIPFVSAAPAAVLPSVALPLRLKSDGQSVSVAIHPLPSGDGVLIKVTPPTASAPEPTAEPAAGPATDPATDTEADPATPTTPTAAAATTTSAPAPKHVPCDIVLVIDESGSMSAAAPAPSKPSETAEDNGLTLMDLCKHACRTILQTLDENDRLGLVTFSGRSIVLQPLTPMTPENKAETDRNIESMKPRDYTNLWAGMVDGMRLFDNNKDTGRVPAIMVLTDGQPNHMCPAQGFVPKMRTMAEFKPANAVPIHTFGFGYSLRGGLLKSLAEYTSGNYSFIPDAGMIATVFVHAIANMQATFASHAALRITYPMGLQLEHTTGVVVNQPELSSSRRTGQQQLTIPLGSIQYGQSRDIYLRYATDARATNPASVLDVVLDYRQMTAAVQQASARCGLAAGGGGASTSNSISLSPAEIAFHCSRSMLCEFIASINPLNRELEHEPAPYSETRPGLSSLRKTSILGTALAKLVSKLPAAAPAFADDAACAALMADINGQVTMALTNEDYYHRWGIYYLPSLQGAHTVQQCNSFKDAGPLLYGAASPLFIACRDALDTAFYDIPAPQPSRAYPRGFPYQMAGHAGTTSFSAASTVINMSRYNNASGPCFASFCRVTLADGRHVRVNRLRRGMAVQTPRGPRAVAAVLKTPVRSTPMVAIGRLLITAWHPVSHNGRQWVFPCRDPAARKTAPVRYTGAIYSVLLQRDADADAHAVRIEGTWVVTLGHGLTARRRGGEPVAAATEGEVDDDESDVEEAAAVAVAAAAESADVRIHPFFGDYEAVCRSLATMDVRKDGVVVNGGAVRSNFRRWHSRK